MIFGVAFSLRAVIGAADYLLCDAGLLWGSNWAWLRSSNSNNNNNALNVNNNGNLNNNNANNNNGVSVGFSS